jgi:NADPH:quinone reductase-like Zn-dependent oxidoreductase
MLLNKLCTIADNPNPLELVDVPDPVPRNNEVLIKIPHAVYAIPSWMKLKGAHLHRNCRLF